MFGDTLHAGFAPHHVDFWNHIWAIAPNTRPKPYVGVWPRGGGKSVSAECAAIALGARNIRRYCVWVSESQDQADDHVADIASRLESSSCAIWYPDLADRAVTKYGHPKAWRRNRLHTRSGFIIDALGLDVASRGLKVESTRPDLIVFDDLDSDTDQIATVERKISTLTRRVLPTGTPRTAVIGIQNLVHIDSIFSRLCDGRAEFLLDRIVNGPIPAVSDLELTSTQTEAGNILWNIAAGTPTWAGLDIEALTDELNTYGPTAFLSEMQHVTPEATGGMFDHITFRRCSPDDIPPLDKIVCWMDPAVTEKDDSDSNAVQIDGISRDGTLYRLYSWEHRTSPQEAMRHAFIKALEHDAAYVGVEIDHGHDLWKSVISEVKRSLGTDYAHIQTRSTKAASARASKVGRVGQMLADYERGRIVHVEGTHTTLERALLRFPRTKPFDLADAAYHSFWDLRRLSRPASAHSFTNHRIDGTPARRVSGSPRPSLRIVRPF